MTQKIRRTITLIFLLLFPITLNYFSPYVSMTGAMNGIIAGSILTFALMFLSGLFFGRAWCSWVCPMSCLSDVCATVQQKRVNRKTLKIIRYSIFTVWAGMIAAFFVMAGGIKSIDPLFMTERVVSVDMPEKYVIYYGVLLLYLILSLTIGKRGACHTVCWMSPFLVAGYHLGRWLHLPQMRVHAKSERCVSCGACTKVCPMSIDVQADVADNIIRTSDCILCGQCIDQCPKDVFSWKKR